MPQRLLLLIDDDKIWRDVLSRYLERFEFNIITAATCAEGLAQARRHRPACILLDFHMPDADGCEFAAKLRENPELRKTPIIMVSGDDKQEGRACDDYQLDGFFLKTWPLDRALRMVRNLLRRVNLERGTVIRDSLRLDGTTFQVFRDSKRVTELPPEQFQFFSLLVEKSPSFVTEREICLQVLKFEDAVVTRDIIRGIAQRLRQKLGPQLGRRIRSKVSSGWVYVPPRVRN